MGVTRATLALTAALTLALGVTWAARIAAASQRTTRDRVYSKDQAARGGKQYAQICGRCHDPGRPVVPGKKAGPILMGDPFLDEWRDRTLGELSSAIITTMPSDGSAVLSTDETEDLVAYLLQVNGFPEGSSALKIDAATRAIVIAK